MSHAADSLLENLNPAQREAASQGDDPLLIIAGAGTGKTTTLVHRVAYLLTQRCQAHQLMLLTFTRRAASQMTERLRKILPEDVSINNMWAGTFHAAAVRILRHFGPAINLSRNFTVHDRSDAEDFIDDLMRRSEIGKGVKGFPRKSTLLNMNSFQVNSGWSVEEVIERNYPDYISFTPDIEKLLKTVTAVKRQLSVLDYDDLLVAWRDVLDHDDAGPRIRDRFTHVLVDEYQDTNHLQAEILRRLSPFGRGLTVVGDDAQSIYSFRAATIENILQFPDQFPKVQTVKLEQNYRSTQPLLNSSNQVIAGADRLYKKRLFSDRLEGSRPTMVLCNDENEEAEYVCQKIQANVEAGIPLHEQAILFRASHHSIAIETTLSRMDIPYVKYGGLRFAEAAHVKDVLGILRLAENPHDRVAGLRVLQLLPGLGPKRATEALNILENATNGVQAWYTWKPPAKAAPLWKALLKLLDFLTTDPSLKVQFKATLEFYKPILRDMHDDYSTRLVDLETLLDSIDQFESRANLLADMTIDPPQSAKDMAGEKEKVEPLVLSTIHSAKGLEWHSVFVVGAADGMLPMPKAYKDAEQFEEERRLFYVALTRAADELSVSYPMTTPALERQRNSWSWSGGGGSGGISPFMTKAVKTHFDQKVAAMLVKRKSNPPKSNPLF